MAPELLSSEQKYGPSIDVYSFGILMWETLALEMPFRGIQADEITERVCQKNERPNVSETLIKKAPVAFVELMFLCWHQNAKRRPPIGEVATILKHDVIVCEDDSESMEGKECEIIDVSNQVPSSNSSTASEILLERRRSIMSQQRRRSSMLSRASCSRSCSCDESMAFDNLEDTDNDEDEEIEQSREEKRSQNDTKSSRKSLEIDCHER